MRPSEERTTTLTGAQLGELLPAIAAGLGTYPYDQYRHYPAPPARHNGGRAPWEAYFLARLERMAADPEWTLFADGAAPAPLLLGVRTAAWDRRNFGISTASLAALYCPDQPTLGERIGPLLEECLAALRTAGVRFVSARVNGDQIGVIHALEDAGFRYYETVLWPVATPAANTFTADPRVRLVADAEIERAAQLAADHGYGRTHFHSDPGFTAAQAGGMNAEWVRTSWRAGDPIAVIESGEGIAGVFVMRVDRELSAHLGATYGRMRFLAVDAQARGQGLGRALFGGAMSLLREMGAQHVDSGYTTKNHASAKLHNESGFSSVYEEATFHLWL